MIVASSIMFYAVVATGFPLFSQYTLPLANILNFLPFYPPIAIGAVYLPIAAFRSKDPTLRRHLGWFGLFVLCFMTVILLFPVAAVTGFRSIVHVAQSEVALVATYFLYRSVRSLVPLNRLSLEEVRAKGDN